MSHNDSKKYYWFKLKESLLTSDKVDFLMQQKEGCNYVLLYQCLCLKLVNNDGVLAVRLGDNVIMPYTPEKIARETRGWFSVDTIRVALGLFKTLGLMGERDDGILYITDFQDLIGSETNAAIRMRSKRGEQLANKKRTIGEHCSPEIDIRDRDRYKRKDIEKDKDIDIENEEVSNEEIDAILDEFYGKENDNETRN